LLRSTKKCDLVALFLCRHQFGETVVETVVFQKSQSSIHTYFINTKSVVMSIL
jgi:hypothetical protein